ncbi:hypothetical protein UP09_04855 [Bradyrhizobium sp. LTSP885]|uniref:carboxypeptidase-like regulatory domain-containing protein n=1 Tax=Bradyrhizobium sp. LTSP885 TaxID=1619232 RepID=UPI0005C91DB3|nr:carboxypeptidase-like regulatory domain-containing protein [Bradyrhizobium sp. LTSP885]KJC50373.1 hypothetical protein UP09_04855 [Bradyrhizobium sp. LTSP885]
MPTQFRKRGIVVDAGGRPVAGALIAVVHGTAAVPEIGIRADDQGTFYLSLPAGSFTVEGHSPDGARGRIDIDVTDSSSEEPLTLRLSR